MHSLKSTVIRLPPERRSAGRRVWPESLACCCSLRHIWQTARVPGRLADLEPPSPFATTLSTHLLCSQVIKPPRAPPPPPPFYIYQVFQFQPLRWFIFAYSLSWPLSQWTALRRPAALAGSLQTVAVNTSSVLLDAWVDHLNTDGQQWALNQHSSVLQIGWLSKIGYTAIGKHDRAYQWAEEWISLSDMFFFCCGNQEWDGSPITVSQLFVLCNHIFKVMIF